jgi:hypothetical protein
LSNAAHLVVKNLFRIIARLVIIFMNPTEIEDYRDVVLREIVMV